jgi:hypothetical protein
MRNRDTILLEEAYEQIKEAVNWNNLNTFKFEVYESRLSNFLNFVKNIENLKVVKKEKDGGYYNVYVYNSGPAETINPVSQFYKEHIKI